MTVKLTNRGILDKAKPIEIFLDLLSFSAGEDTIGEDHFLESNEARLMQNWDVDSIGGMVRVKGITEVADGGGTYTGPLDLLIQHSEGATSEIYGIIEGDLVKKSGATIATEDSSAFTSGVLSQAVSAFDGLWITNSTDNLKKKEIGVGIATPSSVPPNARDRISEHNSRLIAEGGGSQVYGSRVGAGNWDAADAWSASNDAWSIDLLDDTTGHVAGFPSGQDVTVFTDFDTYIIQNQPNVFRRRVTNGIGCAAPYSIAKGNEGVFFFSEHPTRGIFIWDGVKFTNLTDDESFVNDVDLADRVFGVYRNRKYFFFYHDSTTTGTTPNKIKIYDIRFGRWMTRELNAALSDNLGYPALLRKSNNELYIGSSENDKIYELEDSSTSDNGEDTQATFRTKIFTSKDFFLSSGGGPFPADNVRLKLTEMIMLSEGIDGCITVKATMDRGVRSVSQDFDLTALTGDLINTTFTVNTSKVLAVSDVNTKLQAKTVKNSAVGRQFQFEINNKGTSLLPRVRRLKINAIAMEEL